MRSVRRVYSVTVALAFAGTLLLRSANVRAETPGVRAETPAPLQLAVGFGVELSGGFAEGILHGGVVMGLAMKNVLFGLSVDRFGSSSATYTDAAVSLKSEVSQLQVGLATRFPIVSRGDGRVVLFANFDFGLVSRNGAGMDVNNAPTTFHADGPSVAIGPGLRYWVNPHFALAYVTRLRFMWLSGSAGAVGEAGRGFGPSTAVEADSSDFEGVFQLLTVF